MYNWKFCTWCGVAKELSKDNFYTRSNVRDGFASNCKKCMSRKSSIYFQKNKKQRTNYDKKYREKNKEYYQKYYVRFTAINRELKNNNIVDLESLLTNEQWDKTLKHFDNKCAYCGLSEVKHIEIYGQPLHQDHFIPLSKGGKYIEKNIIPTCRACNSNKKNKDFFKWYKSFKFYDEKREKNILKFLNYRIK